MERAVHIAIIDDGVNEEFYSERVTLRHNIEVSASLEILNRNNYYKDGYSHGTTCAAIIKKYAPSSMISSVKVLSDNKRGNVEKLIRGIEWCFSNKVDIINLSLGSINYKDFHKIREIIREANIKGIIVVAALNNKGMFTYPASLSGVIGVKRDKDNILKEGEYSFNCCETDGVEIVASSENEFSTVFDYNNKIEICNSFAAPLISAKVQDIISEHGQLSLMDIKELLKVKSINYRNIKDSRLLYKMLDWACNCIIFRCGYYSEEVTPFRKINIVDEVWIGEASIEGIICDINKYILHDKSKIICVDTLIFDLGVKLHEEEVNSVIDCIKDLKKNLIVFDKEENVDVRYGYKEHLWYPSMYKRFFLNDTEYGECEIPIIAIYNLKNGEYYTIIESLSMLFKNRGYNTEVLVDNPRGILNGFQYIPIKCSDNESKELSIQFIREYEKMHSSDVLILGIELNNSHEKYIEYIDTLCDIDMKIVLLDEDAEMKNSIINKIDNRVIIVRNNSDDMIKFDNPNVVSYIDDGDISKLFEKVISLYEE